MNTQSRIKLTEEDKAEIKENIRATWQYVGNDTEKCVNEAGLKLNKGMIIETVLDYYQPSNRAFSSEAKEKIAFWRRLSNNQRVTLIKEALGI